MARRYRDLRGSARLWREFRETTPTRARRVTIDVPDSVMVMGFAEAILYVTTHGRKVTLYKHEWAGGSRPLLCAGPRKNQLFLVGGRFKVTAAGITDLDRGGRAVDAREKYRIVRVRRGRT